MYPEELDLGTGFWWSPDSKSIAYLQFDSSREPAYPHEDLLRLRALYEPERYPQAGENNADVRLGIVAASGGPTKWLDVGDTRESYLIARAGWMPDSRERLYRAPEPGPEQAGNDLDRRGNGRATVLFRESDPYWINVSGDVRFLKDGKRLLWSSERDGFRHIYLYSIDGKKVKQVTKGDWEVTAIHGVDEAAGRVYYTSSESSHLEPRLYSVKLDGPTNASSPGGRHAQYRHGPHRRLLPGHLVKPAIAFPHRASRGRWRGVGRIPRGRPHARPEEFEILPTEIVSFKAPDGTQLYGRLIKPAGFQEGRKYPVVVTVYGGPGVALPIRNAVAGREHGPGLRAPWLRGLGVGEPRRPGARPRLRNAHLPQARRRRNWPTRWPE